MTRFVTLGISAGLAIAGASLMFPLLPGAILCERRGLLCYFVYNAATYGVIGALGGLLLALNPDRKRVRAGQCAECGYNLTGNTSGVCPECGTAAARM